MSCVNEIFLKKIDLIHIHQIIILEMNTNISFHISSFACKGLVVSKVINLTFFWAIGGTKMLRVETIRNNVEKHQ